jgi:type IV secretory pathway VirJ component
MHEQRAVRDGHASQSGGAHPLAILLSGDGGWANADRALASAMAERGGSVAGLDCRAYLGKRRTPDESARDLSRIIEHYGRAWSTDSVILIGYSRGANMLPFLINRMPLELRKRVSVVALIGLAEHASFEFHYVDLVRDVHRPTDLPTRPEMEKLRGGGERILCFYGTEEKHSLCPQLDSSLVHAMTHAGKHMLGTPESSQVADSIMARTRG